MLHCRRGQALPVTLNFFKACIYVITRTYNEILIKLTRHTHVCAAVLYIGLKRRSHTTQRNAGQRMAPCVDACCKLKLAILLTNQTKLTLTVKLTLTDTVTLIADLSFVQL